MIYLDYAASCPAYPEAAEKFTAALGDCHANPGGIHSLSSRSRALLSQSRKTLAALLSVRPEEVYFTSGGTESNNWAILLGGRAGGRRHIAVSAAEHKSVLAPARRLEQQGFALSLIRPDSSGLISAAALEAALRPDTGLVSIQAVNNETGVMQDVEMIADICRRRGVLFHCDGVQSFGHTAQPLHRADLISLSAHKLGGVPGIGCLTVRQPLMLPPLIDGGGQERGGRSGTENVPGAAAFAAAAELSLSRLPAEQARLSALGEEFIRLLRREAPGMEINGEAAPRHPGILNCHFPGLTAEELVTRLDMAGICASPGAACAARDSAPSHVLAAMGFGEARAKSSVRFSFGRFSTAYELAETARAVGTTIRKEGR